jgi:hypothetical protein
MSPVGFESTVSASERSQTHALDCAAHGVGTDINEDKNLSYAQLSSSTNVSKLRTVSKNVFTLQVRCAALLGLLIPTFCNNVSVPKFKGLAV